jgi:hypothetical protein
VRARVFVVVVLCAVAGRADGPTAPTPLWRQAVDGPDRSNAIAYDAKRGLTLTFTTTDVWGYDGATWSVQPSASTPPAWVMRSAVYDRARDRVVSVYSDGSTWEWDGANWTSGPAAGLPDSNDDATKLVYDDARGRVLAVTSPDFPTPLSTWSYDGKAWADLGAALPRRVRYGLTYDARRDRLVVFGGALLQSDGTTNLTDETWEWDGASWAQRAPATSPGAREAVLAFDRARGRVVLFGGAGPPSGNTLPLNDTWEYDGTTWTLMRPPSAPPPRFVARMVFEERAGATLLIGGRGTPPSNDVWEYFVFGGPCATSDACDTHRCDEGVCCAVECGVCGKCDPSGNGCLAVRGADDPGTCDGDRTCDPNALCKSKGGKACAVAAECASGECFGGRCCAARCAPFGCDASGACKTSCASDGDCAAPAFCNGSACVDPVATCEDAHTSRGGGGGTRQECAPYACDARSGTCNASCTTSDQCADGFSCGKDGTCVGAPLAHTAGCAAAPGEPRGWSPLALVALLCRRRRR